MLCNVSTPPFVQPHPHFFQPHLLTSRMMRPGYHCTSAFRMAQILLRVEPASLVKKSRTWPANEVLFDQPRIAGLVPQHQNLLRLDNYDQIALDTSLKWVTEITEDFLGPSKSDHESGVRDFDFILKSDGLIETIAETTTAASQEARLRMYPARYQIPRPILANIDSCEEKIKRTELFALGCILYELISGHGIQTDLGHTQEDEIKIQSRYTEGLFPDDVWELDKAVRILACWCPEFAKELLEQRSMQYGLFCTSLHLFFRICHSIPQLWTFG
jgi:hypothetical protein